MFKFTRMVLPVLLLTVGVALALSHIPPLSAGVPASPDAVPVVRLSPPLDWMAAGPGEIEPISGTHRVYSETPGIIKGFYVKAGDRIETGQLLAIVDDKTQRARLSAAEAEVAFRESEREAGVSGSVLNTHRDAKDNVAKLEADVRRRQEALDESVIAARPIEEISGLRDELTAVSAKLTEAKRALREQETSATASQNTRTELALQVARAELSVAYAALESTRIRAPVAGTVLYVAKLIGDLVTPAVEDPILTVGDVSRFRARVEVDEADLNDLRVGQPVTLRSVAFAGMKFQGKISQIGPSIRPRRLATPGAPLSPKDTSADILVDIDLGAPLRPGMRVDAFVQSLNLSHKI